jgi:signal transduction histidine kinase
MARIDEGYAYVFKAESMRELLEHVIAAYGPQITERKIKFTIDAAQGLPLIAVDVKRMEFVIRILLENAITYTPVGGSIDVGMYLYKDKYIRFAIRDSGIGIRHSDLSHLFTKFFRSREATGADTEGMGLGLYIAQNIIKRHGGRIFAESEGLTKGSTFTFDLPVAHRG